MYYDKSDSSLQSSDAKLAPKPLHAQEGAASRWGTTSYGLLLMYPKHKVRLHSPKGAEKVGQCDKGGPWCLGNG